MIDAARLREIRRLSRRPYRFVAFCSFLLAGVCGIQALIAGVFMRYPSGFEKLLFHGSLGLVLIAITQGLAALRERNLARCITELISDIAPADESGAHKPPTPPGLPGSR